MDEVYRDYRIAVSQVDTGWSARITHVRGSLAPFAARSTATEGADACFVRARDAIDRYVAFLSGDGGRQSQ